MRNAVISKPREPFQSLRVQPKLEIGQPNDKYEREADAVADRVVMSGGSQPAMQSTSGSKSIQMKCAECEQEPSVQMKSATGQNMISMMPNVQASGDFGGFTSPQLTRSINQSSGNGQKLPKRVNAEMSGKIGSDFSGVNIHTDSKAIQMSQQLGARAFTHGSDVYFNKGQYNPSSSEGKHLLAHELTHVVQQTGTIQRKIEVNPGLDLNTHGYTTTKSGNVYSAPRIVRNKGLFHEVFTGLLGSSRVFKLKGSTNAEIDKSFREHRKARMGVVEFAAKKKYTFGAGSAFKMNPAYWDEANGWALKPGMDREEAINDLNVNPDKYSIACLAATKYTMEGGGKSPLYRDSGAAIDDWIPGDWGYIKNTKFSGLASDVGLEGENIIYTGNDLFWGHFGPGNEYKTLQEWFDQVEGWHGGAIIRDYRRYPNAGLE